jgi:gas vesicle protein
MKISNAALLLFTGFTVGAVAGLLLAPDEGAKTRKKLLKKAKKYKKTLEDKASEYKDKAADLRDNIEGAAQDVKKRFS